MYNMYIHTQVANRVTFKTTVSNREMSYTYVVSIIDYFIYNICQSNDNQSLLTVSKYKHFFNNRIASFYITDIILYLTAGK